MAAEAPDIGFGFLKFRSVYCKTHSCCHETQSYYYHKIRSCGQETHLLIRKHSNRQETHSNRQETHSNCQEPHSDCQEPHSKRQETHSSRQKTLILR